MFRKPDAAKAEFFGFARMIQCFLDQIIRVLRPVAVLQQIEQTKIHDEAILFG